MYNVIKYICVCIFLYIHQVGSYSINSYSDGTFKIYGISQNPDTKEYIIVLENGYCEKCGKQYTDMFNKWCKPCQINDLKEIFRNLTNENKRIDELIQEVQLKINNHSDTIFEWIPYNQFNSIEEIGKGVRFCYSTFSNM